MVEELKYKVGDKVLIEAEVEIVGTTSGYQYGLAHSKTGNFLRWFSADELDKVSVTSPPKPKVTQAVMDWYESSFSDNNNDTVGEVFVYFASASLSNNPVSIWLHDTEYGKLERSKRQHALATLITYGPEAVEVEKEKRYRVKIKGVDQYLRRVAFSNKFEFHEAFPEDLTKQEIIKAGFEGVFDNPMFEVEEVE